MRTQNPLLSSGYFDYSPSQTPLDMIPSQFRVSSKPHTRTTPKIPAKVAPRPRPVHKRHPKPRLFDPFHDHSPLPVYLNQMHISQPTIANIEYALHHGWADKTLENYGSTVDRFLGFCTSEGIPPKFQLPADEFVLCAFAASSAGVHAGSTARNNIAALKAWHAAQNVEWNGGARLHYVLAGVENLAPETSKRPPRPPINATMLRALYDGLDFCNPRDVAIFAAATVCRSSRNKKSAILKLPRTKTKKGGETVVLVGQTSPLDPQIALDMHLRANVCDPGTSLFTFSSPNGPTILTKPKFLQRCNEIWTAAGYPRTTGHSFRIGGTTELLLAGVAPDVVKAMGRWSSNAFLRYWRSLEDLAPIHAKFIHAKS
ncbi:hypothetical protein B0H16DRAFT_1715942 [Mycena metata]|uniref:DNA breaking-rejoining enzyme n=1 Tax=Mycena metata TaxID=1033252 RepID=A0AAD7JQS2_9AGAR|nr:hypothetical protein B0H16DRAFT_1715942 [Mycena metata]